MLRHLLSSYRCLTRELQYRIIPFLPVWSYLNSTKRKISTIRTFSSPIPNVWYHDWRTHIFVEDSKQKLRQYSQYYLWISKIARTRDWHGNAFWWELIKVKENRDRTRILWGNEEVGLPMTDTISYYWPRIMYYDTVDVEPHPWDKRTGIGRGLRHMSYVIVSLHVYSSVGFSHRLTFVLAQSWDHKNPRGSIELTWRWRRRWWQASQERRTCQGSWWPRRPPRGRSRLTTTPGPSHVLLAWSDPQIGIWQRGGGRWRGINVFPGSARPAIKWISLFNIFHQSFTAIHNFGSHHSWFLLLFQAR